MENDKRVLAKKKLETEKSKSSALLSLPITDTENS